MEMEIEMKADLHIHSNFSDSSRTIEEIVSIAKSKNIGLISVCDHASIDAYDSLLIECNKANINCILGVELCAGWNNKWSHVLAYNFDKNNNDMKALIDGQYSDIECEYIVYNMSLDYPQMSLEDYRNFDYPKDKGGWKYLYYATAMGAASSYEEANLTIFPKYSKPNHLSGIGDCSLEDFCSIVKRANGVPVLAHPIYIYDRYGADNFITCLNEVLECGIGGIECYYPSHSKELTYICVDFCKKNDLRITGGSDCHGEFDKSEGFSLGEFDISIDMLDLKGLI